MKHLFTTSCLFFAFFLHSQSHSLRFSLSYHINEVNFYLSDVAIGNNITLNEGGDLKLAAGLGYEYAYSNRNPWFVTLRSEFALRTYSTVFKPGEGFEPGYKHNGPYIDGLFGGGKKFSIKNKFNFAFAGLVGIGMPLLERTEPDGGPTRPSSYNVYNYLPFFEANALFEYYYSNQRNSRWSVGVRPFVRTYLKPLYEINDFVKNDPPYFGGGVSLIVGYLSKK